MHVGSWHEITKIIEKHDSIIIFHHIRPDGDCLGSQFALRELLRDNYPNKKVYAIGDSKGLFSNFLNFDFDAIPSDEICSKSLGVIVDANFKERIECRDVLDKNLFLETIRIDHHPNDDDLDKCTRWVESARIAADEMITELAIQNNWKVSKTAALYMFLGIVTDSGRFMYNQTSQRTHELVAFLYSKGLDAEKVYQGLATTKLSDLKIQQTLMNSLKTSGQVAYTVITYKQTQELGKSPQQVCRPNIIANLEGYPFWVSFNEEEDGRIRVEYRSNGPCVRNVAIKYGGGGHERASGSMLPSFDLIDDVIKDCNLEVERWQAETK